MAQYSFNVSDNEVDGSVVTGEITPGGNLESADSIASDGRSASGRVLSGGGGDTFNYTGALTNFDLDSGVTVEINGNVVDPQAVTEFYELGPERDLVLTAPSSLTSYSFTVDGNVRAGNAAEIGGNDSITDNGDGTYTVQGEAGNGADDDYFVQGCFTEVNIPSGYTITFGGTQMGPADLPRCDSTPSNRVEVRPVESVTREEGTYAFRTDGETQKGPASEVDDTITPENGTWLVEGFVLDEIDAFFTAGDVTEIVDWPDPSSVKLLYNGNDITPDPQAPQASFDFTVETNTQVTFDASASSDPDGSIQSYDWNIAGTSASGEMVTVDIQEGGTYTAELTVTDADGLTDSASQQFTVEGSGPDFDHTLVLSGSGIDPPGYRVEVSGAAQAGDDTENADEVNGSVITGTLVDGTDTYHFDGEITHLGIPPGMQYQVDGSTRTNPYNSVMVVEGASGLSGAPYTIETDGQVGHSPRNNPDDTISGENVTGTIHERTDMYYLSGSVTDGDVPEEVTVTVDGSPVQLNEPPEAAFTIDSPARDTRMFDASGSVDPDGTVDAYEWTIAGDNHAGRVVEKTFDSAGTYTAELVVTGSGGQTDSTSRQFTIPPREGEFVVDEQTVVAGAAGASSIVAVVGAALARRD